MARAVGPPLWSATLMTPRCLEWCASTTCQCTTSCLADLTLTISYVERLRSQLFCKKRKGKEMMSLMLSRGDLP